MGEGRNLTTLGEFKNPEGQDEVRSKARVRLVIDAFPHVARGGSH